MSYAIGTEQYVAILVGWGGLWDMNTGVLANVSGPSRYISRLLVFKLGADGTLPEPLARSTLISDTPALSLAKKQSARSPAAAL